MVIQEGQLVTRTIEGVERDVVVIKILGNEAKVLNPETEVRSACKVSDLTPLKD
jgi:hypothetical protein